MAEEVKLILSLEEQKFLRELKRVQDQTQKTVKGFESLSGAITGVNQAMGIVSRVVGVATGVLRTTVSTVNELVTSASDLQEETNKFNVVFREVAQEANNVKESLTSAYGLSRIESTKLLAATGDLLSGFGFTGKAALDLSKQVNELSVDLASFTNAEGGAAAVSQALTKALLGERESIKQYGIAILDSDVNARIAAKGLENLTGEALRQAKAQATLEIALQQSKNAIGDYARSSDSFANVQRRLESAVENITATLGTAFIPVLSEVGDEITAIITEYDNLAKAQSSSFSDEVTDAVIGFIDAILFLARGLNAVGQTFIALGATILKTFSIAGTAVYAFVEGAVRSIGAVAATLINTFDAAWKGIKATVAEAVDFIVESSFSRLVLDPKTLESYREISKVLKEEGAKGLDEIDFSLADPQGITKQLLDNVNADADAIANARDNTLEFGDSWVQATFKADQFGESLAEIQKRLTRAGESAKGVVVGAPQAGPQQQDSPVEQLDPNSFDGIEASVDAQIAAARRSKDEQKRFIQEVNDFASESSMQAVERKIFETENELMQIQMLNESKLGFEEEFLQQQTDLRLIKLQELKEQEAAIEQAAFEARIEQQGLLAQSAVEAFNITGNAARDVSKTIGSTLTNVFQQVQGAITQAFTAMITGGKSAKEIFKDLGQAILSELVGALVKVGIQTLLNAILTDTTSTSKISAAAGETFANTFASVSAIPVVGPFIAPFIAAANASAAKSGGLGFLSAKQTGDDFISRTGPFQLHRGERVVPSATNADLTRFLSEQRNGNTGSSSEININIQGDVIGEEEFVDQLALRVGQAIDERNIVVGSN